MKSAWMTCLSLAALAQAVASPVGLWRTVDPETRTAESLVRIVETPAGLSGRIERVLDPAKATARCEACSGARKGQPVQGMAIIEGVRRSVGGGHWDGGSILDPKNGKTYRVRLTPLDGGKRLEVRGMLGPFHRDQFWERIE
jgi:uncharacterized protein (DUF2147 family)